MTAGEARTAEHGAGDPAAVTEGADSSGQVQPAEQAAAGAEVQESAGGEQVWPDRQALEGPFTTRQLLRLDEALRTADLSTGLVFSVYVGELSEPLRQHAEQLHGQLAEPARSVLIAVSPNQRALEIVTGSVAPSPAARPGLQARRDVHGRGLRRRRPRRRPGHWAGPALLPRRQSLTAAIAGRAGPRPPAPGSRPCLDGPYRPGGARGVLGAGAQRADHPSRPSATSRRSGAGCSGAPARRRCGDRLSLTW